MNQDSPASLDPELLDRLEFADDEVVPIQELVDLYQAVGWLLYAADPDGLARAVDRSTYVLTARDDEGTLIGLARCLSDDVSIMYLQDLLVSPEWQRRGIGSFLAQVCLKKFEHVRQRVLLTDDEPALRAFYTRLGYTSTDDFGPPKVRAFVAFSHDAHADPDPA
jgi:GNAT superfamily N-acetyltransferase